jgi:hypothetical protein
MRYQFYREHKYVSFALNDLERRIAKADFRVFKEVEKIQSEFKAIVHMLKSHAQYENSSLHELLRKKQSIVYEHVESDHHRYDEILDDLLLKLQKVLAEQNEDERVEKGHQFYLWYRKFVGENLLHLHEEETVILPELQRLYSDEELKAVESGTYHLMTPTQMVHMMEELFPHMNPGDKEAFLKDIKDAQPEKFIEAWDGIQSHLDAQERENLVEKLDLRTELSNRV